MKTGKYIYQKDLIGEKFGKLTVVSLENDNNQKRSRWSWRCRCYCGKEIVVNRNKLISGTKKHCGCMKAGLPVRIKNISGRRFGWLVAEKISHQDKYGYYHWHCKCVCGDEIVVRGSSLRQDLTTNCGCMRKKSCSIVPTIKVACLKPISCFKKSWSYVSHDISRTRTRVSHPGGSEIFKIEVFMEHFGLYYG